jgi:uncharacterized protein (TIGR00255 family)
MSQSPNPTRSMTGFARLNMSTAGRDCVVTIKSVNHKAFDLQLHLAPPADALENEVRKRVRSWISRGYIQVSVQFGKNASSANLQLNEALFRAWLASWKQAAEIAGDQSSPCVESALRIPGMLAEEDTTGTADFPNEFLVALDQVLEEHRFFREREGGAILEDLRNRLAIIARCAKDAGSMRRDAMEYFQKRLRQRLHDMLDGTAVDPQRIAQEAAILTDKTDVSEEITRLLVHVEELGQLLDGGGEIGKKLDFLLQEMNREANTLLAKTANTGEFGLKITSAGLTMKAEIEKMREQALNLE